MICDCAQQLDLALRVIAGDGRVLASTARTRRRRDPPRVGPVFAMAPPVVGGHRREDASGREVTAVRVVQSMSNPLAQLPAFGLNVVRSVPLVPDVRENPAKAQIA